MRVASGLATAPQATPELAARAVAQALARAGLSRASQVILLLSREFSRHPAAAITAAARVAGCLQIDGGTASGLFTEAGWQLDQAAAAALVIDAAPASASHDGPVIAFSNQGSLPYDWRSGTARYGLLDPNGANWMHGHQRDDGCSEMMLPGLQARGMISSGLRCLGNPLTADVITGYELHLAGGQAASDCLRRALPPELREHIPLHQIALLRRPDEPAVGILACNADGSLTLSAELASGEAFSWAIRQALAAEQEMHEHFRIARQEVARPDFALMFSCIGRGPLFYGSDDRDLQAFRDHFPGTPLLGAYGSGQIAPGGGGNRLFHNSAVTLLLSSQHV